MANLASYNGGYLLTHINPKAVWVSVTWADGTRSDFANDMNLPCFVDQFFPDILASRYVSEIRQTFSVPGYTIGAGTFLGTEFRDVAPGTYPPQLDDSHVVAALDTWISEWPNDPDETCYFIFTPPGVDVTFDGESSFGTLGGYHNSYTLTSGQQTYYCVIPYRGDLISRIAHEFVEQITDPIPGQGWTGPSPDPKHPNKRFEVCDYCDDAGPIDIGGYDVSRFVVGGTLPNPSCGPMTGDTGVAGYENSAIIEASGRLTCLGQIIEDQVVGFIATALHRGISAPIGTIAWSNVDQNYTILPEIGGAQSVIYFVQIPAGTTAITVNVYLLTTIGCEMRAEKTYAVVTADQAAQTDRWCELLSAIRHIFKLPSPLPVPIWGPEGPERNYAADPLTRSELDQWIPYINELTSRVSQATPLIETFVAGASGLPGLPE